MPQWKYINEKLSGNDNEMAYDENIDPKEKYLNQYQREPTIQELSQNFKYWKTKIL